jgi:cell division protein FtsQ
LQGEVEQFRMELSLPLARRAPRRAPSRGMGRRSILTTRAGRAFDWLAHNRLALRTAICALIALPLLGGGWLWLRDSSLVGVRHVHITGVHGTDAVAIREALDNAATRMTTMDFDAGALRSAVSSFAIVGALRVSTSFPHSVSISVSERPPVAALLSAGQRTAVAADGTVLGPALLSGSLPIVNGSVEPLAGKRLTEPATVAAVAVLGAAPAAFSRFVVRVYNGPEGLTVAMRNGLLVYFGDSTRPHAKWLSLARVLTSPSAAGAVYVDVRLPERPAAGFSTPSTSSSSSTSSPSSASASAQVATSDPTVAAIAARLEKAAGGNASTSSSTPASPAESETSAGSASAARAGESEASTSSSTTSGTRENESSAAGSSGAGAEAKTPVTPSGASEAPAVAPTRGG